MALQEQLLGKLLASSRKYIPESKLAVLIGI